jgi:hypothetical protein
MSALPADQGATHNPYAPNDADHAMVAVEFEAYGRSGAACMVRPLPDLTCLILELRDWFLSQSILILPRLLTMAIVLFLFS